MKNIFIACVVICAVASGNGASIARAATAQDIQQQIDSHNQTIQQLQAEITRYQTQLDKTSAQSKTLQGAIADLDLNAKKLQASLDLTNAQIKTTDLTIQQLANDIGNKQDQIDENKMALEATLRQTNESDSMSLLENVLTYRSLSEFWNEVDTIGQFQSKVSQHVTALRSLQQGLVDNKTLTEQKKKDLLKLKSQLSDQKAVIDANKSQKAKLLSQSKNTESGYKQLIADKQAKERAFELEQRQLESQLKLVIDPKSVPGAQSGILAWPLTKHVITQYFGNTAFAAAHTAVYNGSGHNGIDLAASIGTPVMAAGSGTVLGTGDTDTVCPGASFGRWVMIQHNNGLSTLYAHLSVIKVSAGQQVSIGDTVGYSGMTGYATGPHLHFTVYASQGVKIMTKKSKSCSGSYTMPFADLQAYLNPLSYL